MNTEYPEIMKAENKKMAVVAFLMISPLILSVVAGIIFNSTEYVIACFAVSVLAVFLIFKFGNLKLGVTCPICKAENMQENYANTVRGSSKNLEHKCRNCARVYIEGKLVE